MKISKYAIITREVGASPVRIIYSTRTAQLEKISPEQFGFLSSHKFDSIESGLRRRLCEKEILVPAEENELDIILRRNQAAAQDVTTLYFVIQPTANCQFACWYCGQEHSNDNLKKDTVEAIIQRIERYLSSHSFKHFAICWFGGEPLLAAKQIKQLTEIFLGLCERFSCSYSAKLVTNGFLLSNRVASVLVKECKVSKIEITLDGDASTHDKSRVLRKGKPTFNRVFNNVISLAQSFCNQVQISLRMNVTSDNYLAVSPLIAKLASHQLQNSVTFYLAPVHSWGNNASMGDLTIEQFATLELSWLHEMIAFGFRVQILPKRKSVVCLLAIPNSHVIDAFGNQFKCSEISYVPLYKNNSRYRRPHISEEIGKGDLVEINEFHEGIRQGTFGCSTCSILPVCGGSCPKEWLDGGRPCPPSKFNIEEKILLLIASNK